MMDGDLFSAGFAWSNEPVAPAATDAATPPRRQAPSEKVTETHLLDDAAATVATVAETEGQRLERLLTQPNGATRATPAETAKTAKMRGIRSSVGGGVAPVASVADWRDRVEDMRRARPAPQPYHTKWRTLCQDAVSFLNLWADDAFRMGWDVLDVFGVNADPAMGRYDRLGLVILLAGRPIQCVDEECAYIGKDSNPTVYRRTLRAPGAVPVWQWVKGCPQ